MRKKLFRGIIVISLLTLMLSVNVFAEEQDDLSLKNEAIVLEDEDYNDGISTYDYSYYDVNVWAYKSKGTATNVSKGGWIKLGIPFTAKSNGEQATIGSISGYSSELSGSVSVTLKEQIEIKLGYTFTKHSAFYVGASSKPLKKNQTATRYYKKCYEKTLVTLKEVKKTYKNGQVIRQKDTGRTKTVYAYKAVEPDFQFTYSK